MSDKVTRLRNCCIKCDAIGVVKRKKSPLWHCERCGATFLKPAQREHEYKFTRLPPILQKVMEEKKN